MQPAIQGLMPGQCNCRLWGSTPIHLFLLIPGINNQCLCDKLPASAGRDAPRFIHDSTSYVTNTHTNHTIHACSLAAVRAATKAMRAYATTRAINHGLRLNSANSPGIVPPPTLHTVTHSHSNTSPHSNISPHSSPSNISPPSSPDP